MGACELVREYNDCNVTELQKKVSYDRNTDIGEDGQSYSGSWGSKPSGLKIINKTFNSYREAFDFVLENSAKWDECVAVKYNEYKPTTVILSLEKSLSELYNEIRAFPSAVVAKIKAQKSATKTCAHCNSVINKSFLKHSSCPVCSHTLFSDTELKKYESLKAKEPIIEAKIKAERAKPAKIIKTHWLAGGLCPS